MIGFSLLCPVLYYSFYRLPNFPSDLFEWVQQQIFVLLVSILLILLRLWMPLDFLLLLAVVKLSFTIFFSSVQFSFQFSSGFVCVLTQSNGQMQNWHKYTKTYGDIMKQRTQKIKCITKKYVMKGNINNSNNNNNNKPSMTGKKSN